MSLPPGPPQVRGISVAHARNLYGYVSDPLGFVAKRFATYGDLYLARTGGELLFALKHPDHIAEVLVRQADGFKKEDFGIEKVLGRGLLTSDGALWRRRRSMVQPAFSRARLRAYGEVMAEESLRTRDRWGDGLDGDVAAEMIRLTLRIVARTLFSHRIADEADTVALAMSRFQESVGTFDLIPDWLPTPKHLRTRKSLAAMDALVYERIDGRIAARARGHSATGDGDLLDSLLDAVLVGEDSEADGGLALADDRVGLRDELLTLYMAGHETTANATAWAWYLLAQHPEVDARLATELHDVLGADTPGVDDLERLPYLRAVCHEVLRLYPPAYVIARRSTREVQLGEWTIPPDQPVVCWIYMTHHDAKWYPDPARFDPDRFVGEAAAKRPKLAWMPFGGGARMCIGKHFALTEMQLVLATLVRTHRFELSNGVQVKPRPRVTLTPAGGVPGRIARRD